MSCAKLSAEHNVIIGYILAKIENRHYYLADIVQHAKSSAKLNNQSVNARYNERCHSVKINISNYVNVDFKAISDAQLAMSIDSFLYNCDNAKTYYTKNCISHKLIKFRESLDFYSEDYDACEWFIDSLPLKIPMDSIEFDKQYNRIYQSSDRFSNK